MGVFYSARPHACAVDGEIRLLPSPLQPAYAVFGETNRELASRIAKFLAIHSGNLGAKVYHESPNPGSSQAARYNRGVSDSDWRLILSEPSSGPMNMALDEAILEAVQKDQAPPTLRFYSWNPPCLSLGYAQSVEDADQSAIEQLGWDLVRRPTGGKAILHTDEITYSIAAPANHPLFVNGVLPSYKRISLALIAGLESMGLVPELNIADPPVPSNGNPVCFQNPSAFEITVEGKKLVGSAQLRRSGGVLQHGSLPLQGELGRICLALKYADEHDRKQALEKVSQHAVTVEHVLGETLTWNDAAKHLTKGIEESLQLNFTQDDPSQQEISRSNEILEERYSDADWTQRI